MVGLTTAFQAQKKKVEFFTQKASFWVVFKVLWGQKALSEAFLRQNGGKSGSKGRQNGLKMCFSDSGTLKTAFQAQKKKVEFFTQKAPFWLFSRFFGAKRRFLRHFYVKMGAKVAQNGVKMA